MKSTSGTSRIDGVASRPLSFLHGGIRLALPAPATATTGTAITIIL